MTTQYRQTPTYEQPLTVRDKTSSVWYRYWQQNELGTPPAAESAVTVTASPFIYTAPRKGMLIVTGGTIGNIGFSRSGTFYQTSLMAGFFPLSQGDQLLITYSVAPTVVWVPM